MPGLDVTIELDDAELERRLAQAIASGSRLRVPMGEIAEEWMVAVHDRFDQERDPLGVPWQKRRGDEDSARKVLHLTGDMERAVVPEFGDDFAQIGVLKSGGAGRYARIHNEGGTIVPKTGKALSFGGRLVAKVVMPKRQFVGFGERERSAVVEIMGDFLRGLFGVGVGA